MEVKQVESIESLDARCSSLFRTSVTVRIGYSCFVRSEDDEESTSVGPVCLMLAFASARNLGSGSCLSEGSFMAEMMYKMITTFTDITASIPLHIVKDSADN